MAVATARASCTWPATGVRFLPLKGRLPKYQYKFAWARNNPSQVLHEFVRFVRERC